MNAAILPQELETKCYCAACGGPSVRTPTADPLAICLACSSGHRYFVMPEFARATSTAKAATSHRPDLEHQTPAQVIEFWLSDPAARGMLNDQLAEMLRTLADGHVSQERLEFSYCPRCGSRLAEYEQPDIWVTGFRCAEGHLWAERCGRLGCVLEGSRFGLRAELSRPALSRLASAWLERNPELNSNLHTSVRRLLEGLVGDGAA